MKFSMRDYATGSDICAADPRSVVGIYRMDEVLGAEPTISPTTRSDDRAAEAEDISLVSTAGGAILGALAGALLMKSSTAGLLIGGVSGALMAGFGATMITKKELA
jgi:hypothetical protein